MPAPWNPTVVKREHPYGKEGVHLSLDEVAKRISEGYLHPRVRTWSIELLDRAREKGESVSRPRERARVLLVGVQKKLWVPDPVGAEYMPGAHLLACDSKSTKPGEICVRGDDCDGLEILLGACWLSVGIHTLVVGHGYDDDEIIEHTLCAAHLDGRWHYGDPSTNLPLGKCVPFTHERLLSVPNVKVICDDEQCIGFDGGRRFDPERMKFVDKGVFVGVDGTRPLAGLRSRLVWAPAGDRLSRSLALAACRC